jgi:hypothetical protein
LKNLTLSMLTFLAPIFIMAGHAQASYVEADLPTPDENVALGTHVVVAGQGLEAGTTWLKAAQTQAMVYRDRHVHGSIRLIAAVSAAQKDTYLQLLRKWGYTNVNYFAQDFLGDRLVEQLIAVPLIASLDFIGHNGAFYGLALQDEDSNHRFYTGHVDRMVGKVRFSKDSFIRLIGCNTGWYLAPYMAKKLGVPAEGTLTSADVEILMSNGSWYFDENGGQPVGTTRAAQNSVSYQRSEVCEGGTGCVRLKAVNSSYVGQHGTYTGALSFDKFFCGSVEQNDCFRRMALSTTYVVGVTRMETGNDFAVNLADQFCPPAVDAAKNHICHEGVVRHVLGIEALSPEYTTLSNSIPQLTCNFLGCQFKVSHDEKGQSILVSTGPLKSTAFVDELNAYRIGFSLLNR